MVLREVVLPAVVLDETVHRLIRDGESRLQRFYDRSVASEQQRVGRSDFYQVAEALAGLRAAAGMPGVFGEWGSGFGVNTCVAAMLGYRAVGIELDPALLRHARALAADYQLSATFVQGNFLPSVARELLDPVDRVWLTSLEGVAAYGSEALAITDFDVIFAYPAPGEARFIFDVFEQCAANAATLISFHGGGELRVQKKSTSADNAVGD